MRVIIVSKINTDRHNINLDIIVNLTSEENSIKKELNNMLKNKKILMENRKYNSIENMRKDRNINKFTYNVYM